MVRKIKVLLSVLVLICAFGASAQAATHDVYDEGTLSTTYVQYFRDILSGADFNSNYVAFRSGQYSYTMVVGELEYNNGVISLDGEGKEYIFSTVSSGYNSNYRYTVENISNFSVNCGDYIIYTDVGDYPELVERGAKYEMLTAGLICIMLCSVVINRIFFKR